MFVTCSAAKRFPRAASARWPAAAQWCASSAACWPSRAANISCSPVDTDWCRLLAQEFAYAVQPQEARAVAACSHRCHPTATRTAANRAREGRGTYAGPPRAQAAT